MQHAIQIEIYSKITTIQNTGPSTLNHNKWAKISELLQVYGWPQMYIRNLCRAGNQTGQTASTIFISKTSGYEIENKMYIIF